MRQFEEIPIPRLEGPVNKLKLKMSSYIKIKVIIFMFENTL